MTTLSTTAAIRRGRETARQPTPAAPPARPAYDDPGVLARIAALPTMSIDELKSMWRDLNGSEPPRYNRKFIEFRLSYRIEELAFGGLKPETRARLAALAEELEAGKKGIGDRPATSRSCSPARGCSASGKASSRPSRCWSEATSGRAGRISRSPPLLAITGTRWNGPLFFGLRSSKAGRG